MGTIGDYESFSTQCMNAMLLFIILFDASGSLALRGPISESSVDYAKMLKSFTNKSDEPVGGALRDELACQFGKAVRLIFSMHVCHSLEKKGSSGFFWFPLHALRTHSNSMTAHGLSLCNFTPTPFKVPSPSHT